MPRRFLSQAEWTRLSQFPDEISANDCAIYFTLTPEDIMIIKQQREAHNRLGFAMLLCSLRYLGYFPADIRNPPANVINYIAQQLALPAQPITEYATRDETRRTHLSNVMDYLGFHRINNEHRKELITWLGERALEHDQPSSLLQMACERLYQLRIVRPAITTMEEVIADARQWAEEKTVQVLVEPLPLEQRKELQTLLVPMTDKGVTPLDWLRKSAEGDSDKYILDTLAKLAFVRKWSVETWTFPACHRAALSIWPSWDAIPVTRELGAKSLPIEEKRFWLHFSCGRMRNSLTNWWIYLTHVLLKLTGNHVVKLKRFPVGKRGENAKGHWLLSGDDRCTAG